MQMSPYGYQEAIRSSIYSIMNKFIVFITNNRRFLISKEVGIEEITDYLYVYEP